MYVTSASLKTIVQKINNNDHVYMFTVQKVSSQLIK